MTGEWLPLSVCWKENCLNEYTHFRPPGRFRNRTGLRPGLPETPAGVKEYRGIDSVGPVPVVPGAGQGQVMGPDPAFIHHLQHIRPGDRRFIKTGTDQRGLPGVGTLHRVRHTEAEVGGVPGGGSAVIHHVFAHDGVPDDIRRPDVGLFIVRGDETVAVSRVVEDVGTFLKEIAPDFIGRTVAVGHIGPGTQVLR